jgi:hypothetical protein
MADAPAPVYARSGRIVDAWDLALTYDAINDVLIVHGQRSGGAHHASQHVERKLPALDLEQAITVFGTAARRFGARRLF